MRSTAAAAVLILLTACGGDDGEATRPTDDATAATTPTTPTPTDAATTAPPATTAPTTVAPGGPTDFAGPGPYPVGTVELDLPEVGPVTVWYPAEPGSEAGAAPATYDMRAFLPEAERPKVASPEGSLFTMDAVTELPPAPTAEPFPLVLFSHGLCGYRQQSSFLTTTVASWGFVVAAPEHTSRDLTSCLEGTTGEGPADVDQLRALVPAMEALHLRDEGPLAGLLDTRRVAVVGHSAGGGAAIRLSGDEAVDAYVALAAGGGGGGSTPPSRPALYVAGDADAIIPIDDVRAFVATVPEPRALAVLGGVTHLGFMDICTIGQDQGGVLQIAADAGVAVPDIILRLFADGCAPQYTPAETAWPAIRHLTVAHLRQAFGIDAAPAGFADLEGAYDLPVTLEG